MSQKVIETIEPNENTVTQRNNVVACRVVIFERPDGMVMLQPRSATTGKNLAGNSRIIQRPEYDAAPAGERERSTWALERCGLRTTQENA